MIDALRRASAGRITAVIPYFGYRVKTVVYALRTHYGKVVADFLSNVGVDRVLTIDLHAEQIKDFLMCQWTMLLVLILLADMRDVIFMIPSLYHLTSMV